MLITVNSTVPIRTLRDFIDYGKSNPGKLSYGSSGLGGSSHLAVALFEMMSGAKFNHIPYKGMAPATSDMLAGHVNFVFGFEASLGQYFNSDKVAILAVTADKRLPALPNVPAVAELIPGYAATSWFAVVAPPGTPADIVARLSEAINEILRTPDAQKRMQGMGQIVLGKSPAEAKAFMVAEGEQWGKVVRATGATAE
jgi:tripartite-type tricarboxylate transporter receptor subunit TctC